ncbi:MAG: NYN domain-containing protein [Sedimentisphaerales bacterium]|nr:NYN domain-containing protein [Sedimentisphaerales bacterium]
MARYCFYIDGFNVYHALEQERVPTEPQRFPYRKYKWLDYRTLAKSIIGNKDVVTGIFYFTTYVHWKSEAVTRHKDYIKALRSVGVEEVMGRFMEKTTRCHICRKWYKTHEEKQTDVNIALKILGDAIDDLYDRALIISADSDLLPAIKAVHRYAPDKEIGVMFPIGRNCLDLQKYCDFRYRMKKDLLARCQFSDKVKVGDIVIERPDTWY